MGVNPMPQLKRMVSYSAREADMIRKKEEALMDHYRWNYSQLHKNLVLDRYDLIKGANL